MLPGRGPPGLVQAIEDQREVLRADPRSRIPHGDLDLAAGAGERHVDAPACGRELERVGQEVADGLLQPAGIAARDFRACRHRRVQFDALLRGSRLERLHGGVHDRRGIQAVEFEREAADEDARDVEQILDQAKLHARVTVDDAEAVSDAIGRQAPLLQHLAPAEHRVERRAQLVRQHGEERVLRLVRTAGVLAGGVQFARAGLERDARLLDLSGHRVERRRQPADLVATRRAHAARVVAGGDVPRGNGELVERTRDPRAEHGDERGRQRDEQEANRNELPEQSPDRGHDDVARQAHGQHPRRLRNRHRRADEHAPVRPGELARLGRGGIQRWQRHGALEVRPHIAARVADEDAGALAHHAADERGCRCRVNRTRHDDVADGAIRVSSADDESRVREGAPVVLLQRLRAGRGRTRGIARPRRRPVRGRRRQERVTLGVPEYHRGSGGGAATGAIDPGERRLSLRPRRVAGRLEKRAHGRAVDDGVQPARAAGRRIRRLLSQQTCRRDRTLHGARPGAVRHRPERERDEAGECQRDDKRGQQRGAPADRIPRQTAERHGRRP